ncbi:DUF1090 domain-containing protein [Marinobacter fonticola]|uniref:DUF1090 domain-containing protein n=1 Tax=Marinobacter fonticola TaxID=2603215 RepID=UPI00143CC570|nr:DUF1090 domain-containing protein [Marinobacter fonticola]
MKKLSINLSASLLAMSLGAPVFAASDENPHCAAKEAEVQQQIDAAREHGNTERLRGLEASLEGIRNHCSDEKVIAEAEAEVQESMEEVEERQRDMEEALQEGDMDEVEERREKLEEATSELEEHTQKLKSMRD